MLMCGHMGILKRSGTTHLLLSEQGMRNTGCLEGKLHITGSTLPLHCYSKVAFCNGQGVKITAYWDPSRFLPLCLLNLWSQSDWPSPAQSRTLHNILIQPA